MTELDETHDPAQRSWVDSANAEAADFPLQNLPFGRFREAGSAEPWRIGIAIGDQVLDLRRAAESTAWEPAVQELLAPLAHGELNPLMAAGGGARRLLRRAFLGGLSLGSPMQSALSTCLIAQTDAEMALPCRIGDYTDFYTSIHHATSVGKLFRPDNPLLPNYKWVPIGYHGRASSIGVSGQRFVRPRGQLMPPGATEPRLGACARLDYELELALFVSEPNELGQPVPIDRAEDHLFGLALFNDWSARDVQGWEYQPLGPFLAKNFASTVSPWIVTAEALQPFRAPFTRPDGDPAPLPYLDSPDNRAAGGFDITLEVLLQTASMAADGVAPHRLSQSNYRDAYWTAAQLIAHHTVNGCNLQSGDLLGSGTLSGPRPDQAGSLLELSEGGKRALQLPNGETRSFLADGDTVILRGWCERPGARRIGFGECRGMVLPAPAV